MMTLTPVSPPATVTWYPQGTTAPTAKVGDFILVQHTTWQAKLIRFGQRIRFRRYQRRYTWANHAMQVVSVDNGRITCVEETGRACQSVNLATYQAKLYAVVSPQTTRDERQAAATFAIRRIGHDYGWITIGACAFNIIFRTKFSLADSSHLICSALVARAQERAGLDPGATPPEVMMPADLAEIYDVGLPSDEPTAAQSNLEAA